VAKAGNPSMPHARSRKVKDSVNEVAMFASPGSGGSLQPKTNAF
jgi:hypothetical protein